MKFLSVCSGIEAASCAWHPLGWRAHAFAEIEKFPSAVLAHHYPDVPNWGDMTKFKDWPDATFDVLVGGTPCQSFSVAGLRKGMADPRGNLALVYLGILDRYRPRWMVWENVPGVLSSNGGRDFGSFLGGLGELGYGFAYRVLDAQFFGLAQRRKRVFVVGHLGDWRRAAAVLFEPHSLSGHPAPRREAGKGTAPTLAARTKGGGGLGTDFDCDGGLIARAVKAAPKGHRDDPSTNNYVVAFGGGNQSGALDVATAQTAQTAQTAHAGRFDFESDTFVMQAGAVRENPDSGPDGIGVQTGIAYTLEARSEVQAICFSAKDHGADAMNDLAPTLRAGGHDGSHANAGVMPAIAFNYNAQPDQMNFSEYTTPTLTTSQNPAAMLGWRVRRLTPRECERLQGFPDDYTAILYRGKPAADGPRYKALGNSMAVPVMCWIGERIGAVDAMRSAA